jgi:hypothetical protein
VSVDLNIGSIAHAQSCFDFRDGMGDDVAAQIERLMAAEFAP